MNPERLDRTRLLLGDEAINKLSKDRVAVFGIGGVGGYTVEALARSGVGNLILYDNDVVSESNINRQIIALSSTVGQAKVDVAKSRILEINPDAYVETHKMFFLPEVADSIDFSSYDYIVDAIDTVSGKIALIECANRAGVKVISSMGAGNKLNAWQFEVADIYETSVCPLAKVMRRELKERGIEHCKVVYSKESPIKTQNPGDGTRPVTGSVAFVPSVVGLIMAGEVIKDLCEINL